MMPSRCLPLRLMVCTASSLLGCRRQIVREDVGVSQDGGHGGADLMAHVGQEFALGPVGGLGRAAGLNQPSLARLRSVMS